MNKRDAKRFERLLLSERDRLTSGIKRIEQSTRDDVSTQQTGSLSNYAEVGTDNFERETALHIASDEAQWLSEIDDALRRIQDGTFGVCESCSKPIPKKRLEVFPSARHCVACQERLEREGKL